MGTVWESLKHHQDLINDKEVYPVLGEHLFKGAAGIDYMIHATFSPNEPYDALSAPVTEIAIWTLKENADKQAFTETLEKLISLANSNPVVTSGGWGPTAEDENKFVVLLGWPSLEVCMRNLILLDVTLTCPLLQAFKKLVQEDAKVGEYIAQLRQHADSNLKHYVFTKHV